MSRHLALVEDDDVYRDNTADHLRSAGYRVDCYDNKDDAIAGLLRDPAELLLLDIKLHNEQDAGFAICRAIRPVCPLVPVIFLTSYAEEVNRVSAWRAEADDILPKKGVSSEALVSRIEAIFARIAVYLRDDGAAVVRKQTRGDKRELTPKFDHEASTATWRGQLVDLTLTQFIMLWELCRRPGHSKTNDELKSAAGLSVADNTVAQHIAAIRRTFAKLEEPGVVFDRIKNDRRRGYRWVP